MHRRVTRQAALASLCSRAHKLKPRVLMVYIGKEVGRDERFHN